MSTNPLDTGWIPERLNAGPWFTSYAWPELEKKCADTLIVLPICSLGTPASMLADLAGPGGLVLPPLFHEALDAELKGAILERIHACFPYMAGSAKRAAFRGRFEVRELPPAPPPPRTEPGPRILAVSFDTSVEEHGPHLPLSTDRIQTHALLRRLAESVDGLHVAPPLEYGQLTWALPIGLSIDLTAPLTARYVRNYADALIRWLNPAHLYAVCVHGSLLHRQAVVEGLSCSAAKKWKFRWLHEPLSEFTWSRGDAHAGGVETALIRYINPMLVDASWWPGRMEELTAHQTTLSTALEAAKDLPRWVRDAGPWNGIVGDVRNALAVDANHMMGMMLDTARGDVGALT